MIYVGDVVNKREFEHPVKLDFVVVKNILNNRRKNKLVKFGALGLNFDLKFVPGKTYVLDRQYQP